MSRAFQNRGNDVDPVTLVRYQKVRKLGVDSPAAATLAAQSANNKHLPVAVLIPALPVSAIVRVQLRGAAWTDTLLHPRDYKRPSLFS